MHNSPVPIGPIRRHCMNVETPDANKAIDTRKPVVSKSRFNAPEIIRGGVIIATKIASKCWMAANKASFTGGLSSRPYIRPVKFFFSSAILFTLFLFRNCQGFRLWQVTQHGCHKSLIPHDRAGILFL